MAKTKIIKEAETPKKRTSPLFNSTSMVEIKRERPAGINPYKEKWDFIGEVIKLKND